jgi:hypothetical protein
MELCLERNVSSDHTAISTHKNEQKKASGVFDSPFTLAIPIQVSDPMLSYCHLNDSHNVGDSTEDTNRQRERGRAGEDYSRSARLIEQAHRCLKSKYLSSPICEFVP